MKCKLCGGDEQTIYMGPLKTGLITGHTDKNYPVFQCKRCKVIWNEAYKDLHDDFYESGEYRERIEGNSESETYHQLHDQDVLWHLETTGTDIFRQKVVCDIGCGGGSFLDFINTVSKKAVAIEPNKKYHDALKRQGYSVFQYAQDAMEEYAGKIDVITSFDVIEHVNDPKLFAKDAFELLSDGGKCIIGTPTDYPVLRQMLGDEFNRFIFQVQHPWVFSETSLRNIFEEAGFKDIQVIPSQKFGLGNLLAWLNERKPRGDVKYPFISPAIDAVYRQEMAKNGYAEYLTVYAEK